MTHCKYLTLLCEDFPIDDFSSVCNNMNHISGILACDQNQITVNHDYFYLKLSVYLNNLYTENDYTKTNMKR